MLPPRTVHENRASRRSSGDLLDRGYWGRLPTPSAIHYPVAMHIKLAVLLHVFCSLITPVHAEELPPDLGTRTAGIDWPDFLGPQRDSRSPETGILTDWAARPLRLVWQCELG